MMAFVRTYIQTLVTLTLAAACVAMIVLWPQWRAALAQEGYYKPGRMTGGGNDNCTVDNVAVKHGFVLQCDPNDKPNMLEVNWTIDGQEGSHHFHLKPKVGLESAFCEDTDLTEAPPAAGFDTYTGTGIGIYNKNQPDQCDAFAEWVFTDAGEPSVDDSFEITITCEDTGQIVLDILCPLGGNHQAHK
jgi:hypothetical protein